ncbi:MAG: LuxR C-terminal-related transcriptional regulator [Defluviitaleaceae bacterium]|nr:LuxR C-terminal-related transcriptional regulator [Defluviitaleaceae bacterium]
MDNTSNLIVKRHSLNHIFNELKNYQVVAVCAPAGYGKTVAVTQWLGKGDYANAIYYIDEIDNNPSYFCERFCKALCDCQPQNQILVDIVSHESFQHAPDKFSARAISALSKKEQAVLAIDDVHLIHSDAVLKLMLIFIKRLPKNFQVILISRHDLPHGLSELWLKGQVGRVNAEQLLFNNKDIMALYRKRGGQITNKQAEEINRQTHGWAIGIKAYLLSDGELSEQIYNYLGDFIQINIWEKWDEKTHNFMICTANLRELIPSLCNALTGLDDSDKFLEELVQKGAFITRLQKESYRYHHLFQQFLTEMAQKHGEEFLQSLIEKEGYWHLSKNNFYSAIDCFIRCKNHDGIKKCFELLKVSDHNYFSIERLLPIIKHPEVVATAEKYPRLIYLIAWFTFAEGDVENAVLYMDSFYARCPERVYSVFFMNLFDFRKSLIQIINGISEQLTKPEYTTPKWSLSFHMPLVHRGQTDFSDMVISDASENFNVLMTKVGSWLFRDETQMQVNSILAGLYYEQGQLERAHKYALESITEMRNHFTSEAKFCAMSIFVYVLDSIEESEEATAVIESISKMIEEDRAYHLSNNFNALIIRRKFTKGCKVIAENWIKKQSIDSPTLWSMYADFTTCRAFITTGKYDSALVLLRKILKIANAYNRVLDIIEAQVLMATAYWIKKRRFQNEAFECLENAARAAHPYGYVQIFTNEGSVLASMLYKLKKRIELRGGEDEQLISFIKMLYLETRDSISDKLINESEKQASLKFTDKQKEVIALLCEGKSYKEITNTLGIKSEALRSRIVLIYSKLEVSNAIDAVSKTKAIGLLT